MSFVGGKKKGPTIRLELERTQVACLYSFDFPWD